MIDSVIFDMDGTILNTLDDLTESVNFVMAKFNFPTYTSNEVKYFVGNGVDMLFKRALPTNCDNSIFLKCVEEFKTHYAKNTDKNTRPYDGIIELMKNLKNDGISIGVLSNKFDLAVKILSERYFNGLIDASVGQSVSIPPKPLPLGFFECVKMLNSKNPIMVGDSEVDIQTAKNANIPIIAVTWGFREKNYLMGADYLADDTNELKQIIYENI